MTEQPYNQETDATFDELIGKHYPTAQELLNEPHRHPGGRVMTREPSTAEGKKAQAWQMAGCASLFLSICAGLSLILAVWKW